VRYKIRAGKEAQLEHQVLKTKRGEKNFSSDVAHGGQQVRGRNLTSKGSEKESEHRTMQGGSPRTGEETARKLSKKLRNATE